MNAQEPHVATSATTPDAGARKLRPGVRDEAWVRFALLTAAGSAALAMGVLVYLADRPSAHAILMPDIAPWTGRPLFGALGQWLPSFVHPLAFSLFTAAALKPGVAARVGACVAWSAINVAFELGQHPALRPLWTQALASGTGPGAIRRSVLNYFLLGTFDPFDVLAAILAAPAAVAIISFVDRRQGAHRACN